MNMDATLYLHSAIFKQTDCSATHYSSESSTRFNSETGEMASLSNSVTKTQHCARFCRQQSLSTIGTKLEGFSVYIFDSSCNGGTRSGDGRINDGSTKSTTKLRDYQLEKLVEEESKASCKSTLRRYT